MRTAASRWKLVMTAMAFTMAAPALAQDATDDPFLKAMMQDEQKATEEKVEQAKETPQAAEQAEASVQAPAKPATLEETSDLAKRDTTPLLDNAAVMRELGPTTGLFNNDAAFDGKTVTRVVFRYAGHSNLPESRLRDVVQTRQGGRYLATRVNADLSASSPPAWWIPTRVYP